MKICFFAREVFSLGGVQRVVTVLANELCLNHEVYIVCNDTSVQEARHMYGLNEKIKVIYSNEIEGDITDHLYDRIKRKVLRDLNTRFGILNNRLLSKYLVNVYYPQKIRNKWIKFFNSSLFDIVIGVEGYYSLLLGVISEEINCKVIGWQHSTYEAYFHDKNYYLNQDILFFEYIPKLDKYIVLTESDQRKLYEKKNIISQVIYNPLSFYSDKKCNLKNNTILSMGRLVPAKGFDMLISAFSLIAEENPDWNLKIVGDGPCYDNLKKLIEKKKLLDRIQLNEGTSNIENVYLSASIYVSAARWEGFGLTIIEAMEYGIPVIAFKNSGPEEIISSDGENGILVEKNNVFELAKQIKELIIEREKMERISHNGIIRAKDYNRENIALIWNELLKSL